MAPSCRALCAVQVTVSPAWRLMASGVLPSSQVKLTRFQPGGTVSATSYRPGIRLPNDSESAPAAPGSVVVRVNGDGLSVFDVKSNAPNPSSVIFSTMIVPRARLWYVQSSTSDGLSIANVTVAPLTDGVTPELAEQSTLTNSQPTGSVSSTTV